MEITDFTGFGIAALLLIFVIAQLGENPMRLVGAHRFERRALEQTDRRCRQLPLGAVERRMGLRRAAEQL